MQQGVALLKELRDNMIGFADQRIEKISRLYSKLMLYFQHFGRNCYMQGFRDHAEIKKIHDLGVDAPM